MFSVGETGTITMKPLAVTNVIPLEHSTQTGVLSTGALVSQEANQDPIELAFLAAARERTPFLRSRQSPSSRSIPKAGGRS